MIVPCIDLQRGRAVQLVRGRKRKLAVADVFGLVDRFRRYGILHVIDLDAAMRRGSNAGLVRAICLRAANHGVRVRVGGGIRRVAQARRLIRSGAEKVIIGTAAFCRGRVNHPFLRRLKARVGRRRLIIALDTERDFIVVRGWRQQLQLRAEEVMSELEPYCSEFLCTCVDREGMMRGTNLALFRKLRRATGLPITAAGGIRTLGEVRALGRLGMDAAVGMALYLGGLR
jgi:phosphoribosylformimino-5-aminoimidazole carboxamide ribonucleotide (ProFAR) isomerase